MKIIIAPDSFKECLPSRAVASAMAAAAKEALAALAPGQAPAAATEGDRRAAAEAASTTEGGRRAAAEAASTTEGGRQVAATANRQVASADQADRQEAVAAVETAREAFLAAADVVELPLADGGEGTVDILTAALGGTLRSASVSDSLGRPLTAPYGVVATAPSGVATARHGVDTARHGVSTAPLPLSTEAPSAPLNKSADGFQAVFPTAGAQTDAADGFQAVFPTAGANTDAADGFSPVFPTVGAETEAVDGFSGVFPTVGVETEAVDGFRAVFPTVGAKTDDADGFRAVFPTAGTDGGALGVIEVAAACGLERLRPEERNPLVATSRGVGELIMAAYADGCRRFIIGLGGSATCDGGEGMLSVPGVKEVLRQAQFEVLCDVDAPFVGPLGAARVFAPQKGASPEDVEVLEKRMQARAAAILRETGRDVSAIPGAGAAGGLGGAFLAYANATLSPGISRVLDLVGFNAALLGSAPASDSVAQCAQDGGKWCAQDGNGGPVVVITGEGRSDLQTLQGKLPLGVLHRVRALTRAEAYQATQDLPSSSEVAPEAHQATQDLPSSSEVAPEAHRMPRAMQSANADALGAHSAPIVLLISGAVAPGARTALQEAGFSAVVEATPAGTPLSDALDPDFARRCIEHAVKAALRNCL